MSRQVMIVKPKVAQGEIVADFAVLDARDLCYMNFARLEFDKLAHILTPLIDPLLCRENAGVASDIARHIEQIRSFSGNFCWKHRHVGAAFGKVGEDDV